MQPLPSALRTAARWLALSLTVAGLAACTESGPDQPDGTNPPSVAPTGPPSGETDFVSADGRVGEESGTGNAEGDAAADGGRDEATVEEGDIYRVLRDGLLLNLNSYRGLQVLDVSDPTAPSLIGRAQISGYPVEMYTVDDRVYILMNQWHGYFGAEDDDTTLAGEVRVEQRYGGVVAVADIADPTAPQLLDYAFIPGNILTSRLKRDGDAAALYVAAGGYGEFEQEDGSLVWETRTYVRSFDVSGGGLRQASELNLGGYVSDIQATPDTLLVARWNWDWQAEERGSELSLIDIRDTQGQMVAGDDIRVAGQIENKFNMDVRDGILRVVSGNSWNSEANTNFLETFDVRDLSNAQPIDRATFGDNEDLYATLFLENAAFFVTYRRVDPFHAFEIRDDGTVEERSEFVVSGWNDYFRPVLDDDRLIGIGVNDEDGRTMAVSLYDITDLDNPEPLITRAEVDASFSWSEASWDDRAFSVVEGAVSVLADDGTVETGLILLPYTGYAEDWSDYTAAVQIFTFSETTLTRRGIMEHGTPVRRSFETDNATANLSEAALSLFDTSDPDAPAELGRLELAPNYTDYFVFGEYAVRVKNLGYDYAWIGDRDALPPTQVEVISRAVHPDEAPTLATVEIPASAQLHQVGDSLVAMTRVITSWDVWPYDTQTHIDVIDLSRPTAPALVGSLDTDALPAGDNAYYGWGDSDCFDCGWGWGYGYGDTSTVATSNALVLPVREWVSEIVGTERSCRTFAVEEPDDCDAMREEDAARECARYVGGITCTSLDGGPEVCTGALLECVYDANWNSICEEVSTDDVATETNCYESDRYRYWSRATYHFVDLRDPSAPAVGDAVAFGERDEFISTLVVDDRVYMSYTEPLGIADDGREYVRYFFRELDATNPAEVAVGEPVNVPGELLRVVGDDLLTQDRVYGDEVVETSLARLTLYDGRAYLQSRLSLPDQAVERVVSDGEARLLVAHRNAGYRFDEPTDYRAKLSIVDATGNGLRLASTVTVDDWASLQTARNGRALYQVPGGLLVVDVSDAESPQAAAFYPTRGWPRAFTLVDNDVVFPAGRFGLYRLPFDAYNLIAPL